MEEKNIYLMDKPIGDISKDELDYRSIVEEIVNNIQNNQPPYNIALIGKWGTGKSSILECVKKQLEEDKDNKYLFTQINAWKYEKQEIRKSFILEILDKLPKNKNIVSNVEEVVNNIFKIDKKEKKDTRTLKSRICGYLKDIVQKIVITLIPLAILFIISLLVIDVVLNIKNIQISDYNGIRLDIVGAFIVAATGNLFMLIKETVYGKKDFYINLTETLKDTNFYEQQMRNAIKLYKNQNAKFKAIICVVDDIDRLNASKMVEAISALKSFIGIENIIFIVPYDTNILAQVLANSRQRDMSDGYELLEGELILNKLFQFKIYMPELIPEDMYEYSKNLVENEHNDIYTLLPNKKIWDCEILPILMYESVDTPRHAKQLINSYIAKYNIAVSRTIIEPLSNNVEEFKKLAVLTVLENDFNEVYSKIIMYPNILKDFAQGIDKRYKNNEMKDIYDKLNLGIYKGRKMKSLVTFLRYTATIETSDLKKFIYLNDSKIDKMSGGKCGKEFRSALRNFESKKAIEYMCDVIDISNVAIRELSYNNSNVLKKKNIVLTLIDICEHIQDDSDKINIINLIEDNINIINSRISITKLIKLVLDDKEQKCFNIKNALLKELEDWKPLYVYFEEQDIQIINEKNDLENELGFLFDSYFNLDIVCQEKIKVVFERIATYIVTEEDINNDLRPYMLLDLYEFIKPKLNSKNYCILGDKFLEKLIYFVKIHRADVDILKAIIDIYIGRSDIDNLVKIILYGFEKEKIDEPLQCLEWIYKNLKGLLPETKKMFFEFLDKNLETILQNSVYIVKVKKLIDLVTNEEISFEISRKKEYMNILAN